MSTVFWRFYFVHKVIVYSVSKSTPFFRIWGPSIPNSHRAQQSISCLPTKTAYQSSQKLFFLSHKFQLWLTLTSTGSPMAVIFSCFRKRVFDTSFTIVSWDKKPSTLVIWYAYALRMPPCQTSNVHRQHNAAYMSQTRDI